MASEWDERDELSEEDGDDPGFLGGGGPAETIEGGDAPELDEHGDNLTQVDEDEL